MGNFDLTVKSLPDLMGPILSFIEIGPSVDKICGSVVIRWINGHEARAEKIRLG